MKDFICASNVNPRYIEEMYLAYKKDPSSVSEQWQIFFMGYQLALENEDSPSSSSATSPINEKEIKVTKFINAYRRRGHLVAKTNPVRKRRKHPLDLSLEYFGLKEEDLDTVFNATKEIHLEKPATLKEIRDNLEEIYCTNIGVEYRYISDPDIRKWIYNNVEKNNNRPQLSTEQRKRIYNKLVHCSSFEKFLHVKYVGQKRFSLEGLEAAIPALDCLFQEGARLGVQEFVMGMPHRGRLNVLTTLFEKDYQDTLAEFEGCSLSEDILGDGDVKYHLGKSADIITEDNLNLHLSLLPNPSHLEAVNPVVLGMVRAKWEKAYSKDYKSIVPIIVHGDAAIAGQGIMYEIVNMQNLDGYSTGGAIHIVFNNQIGFTANYLESRSSLYCTDIAKVLSSPVFHVNADNPENVAHVCQLAIRIRQKFNIDVFIDIVGYRRYGHNESDEPRFTQPKLYDTIKKHETVLQIYQQQLLKDQVYTQPEMNKIENDFTSYLQECLDKVRNQQRPLHVDFLQDHWQGFRQSKQEDFEQFIATGVAKETLESIIKSISSFPESFNIFPKLSKLLKVRSQLFEQGLIDWGSAEALAYGSLLLENYNIRLSGQDSRRGTFSHRHAVLIDYKDEKIYTPLNHLADKQGKIRIYNSHLSEYGVLGFEYGYSLATPKDLTIWEAQFGDFANGAQIIIDQFISSAESKWQRMSGLVLFLPHGYEGMGPEHSSARIERFLSLSAERNMQITNPSTPSNFFHLLRKQMLNKFRTPLVIFTPKSLLRAVKCRSKVEELTNGKFQAIIDDATITTKTKAKKIDNLILCSGKIYYELLKEKEDNNHTTSAIVRLEQLYPAPKTLDKELLEKYEGAAWTWVQEEPLNMGPWFYIKNRFSKLKELKVISRKKSASPAPGNSKIDLKIQQDLIKQAFNNEDTK